MAEKKIYKKEWRLKDVKPISADDLLERINNIRSVWYPWQLRDKALIATLYLTAGRIGEVVKNGIQLGLCKDEITPVERDGREFTMFNLRNLKNPDKTTKVVPVANDNKKDRLFLGIINEYLNVLKKDEPLFPIGIRRAQQIIDQRLGKEFSPHYFRHMRLTHLTSSTRMNQWDLMMVAGWSSPNMARAYIHADPERLLDKI